MEVSVTALSDEEEAMDLEDASNRAQAFLYKAAFRFMDAEGLEDKTKTMVAVVLASMTVAALMAQMADLSKEGFKDLAEQIFDETLKV
jgi:hypothetical protein